MNSIKTLAAAVSLVTLGFAAAPGASAQMMGHHRPGDSYGTSVHRPHFAPKHLPPIAYTPVRPHSHGTSVRSPWVSGPVAHVHGRGHGHGHLHGGFISYGVPRVLVQQPPVLVAALPTPKVCSTYRGDFLLAERGRVGTSCTAITPRGRQIEGVIQRAG
jgi:hypothetical protein